MKADRRAGSPSVLMNVDSGEKTWLTSKWMIDALGEFELDPCCPPEMPWSTARRMVCRPEDGLAADWRGKRIWLNPPYGRESVPFFKRMVKERHVGTALVFARTDTALWQELIFPNADAVLFLRGRIRFCRPDGTPGDSAPAPSALVAFGKRDADALSEAVGNWTLDGFVVRNREGSER